MVDQDRLFARLARSTFRSRFRLGGKERQYCLDKGPEIIDRHAADFIRQRLAPAAPINDGKQTPMRGHPVFIAQPRPLPAVAAAWKNGMPFPTAAR